MQPGRSQFRLRLYCLVLLLLPAVALCGAISIAKTGWFLARAVPPYLRMLDAESSVHGRGCDVLIYGDSTALTGLEPWVIQQQTGLRTCSIAQTKGTAGVSGVQFLRNYLATNPAPRFLVLAFSPEDWRPIRNWGETAYVEGVLQLVRHSPLSVYASALATHPNEAFGFVTFVYKSAIQSLATHGRSAQWPASGSVRDGHMTLPSPTQMQCAADDAHSPAETMTPVPAYAQSLRQEFTSATTQVLLVAPTIPDCDPKAAFFAQRLNSTLDLPVSTQPIGFYNDSDRHFTAQGAEAFSQRVAGLLLQRMAR